jgi:hypothetical protein
MDPAVLKEWGEVVGDTSGTTAGALVCEITDFFPQDRRTVLRRSCGERRTGLAAKRSGWRPRSWTRRWWNRRSARRCGKPATRSTDGCGALAIHLGACRRRPRPLTLRQLHWIYAARRRDQWCHTANVMALIANCHRAPKRTRRPFDLVDFLPAELRSHVRRASGIRLTSGSLSGSPLCLLK